MVKIKITEIEPETKIKIKTITGKIIYLELDDYPSKARNINGVSDIDEYLIKGYILTKKGYLNMKYNGRKVFIIKESNIEVMNNV